MKRNQTCIPRLSTDLILWDETIFHLKLMKYLRIDSTIDPNLHYSILNIIQDNWDSFCEQEDSHPILDFEFCIDIGKSQPVYYH